MIMEGLAEVLAQLAGSAQKLAKRLAAYERLCADRSAGPHARERALGEMAELIAAFPAEDMRRRLADWHAAESRNVQDLKEQARFEFGRQLMQALAGSGMAVRGQLPGLRVGLFTLKVDFDSGTATVFWGPEIERLRGGLKLDPAGLAVVLRNWNESLQKKAAAPEDFARRLHAAYRRACAAANVAEGGRVFLVNILAELVMMLQPESFRVNPAKEKFVEYPRVRFSYDLFRLRQAGVAAAGGAKLRLHVANFDATTEKARAFWVPDNEEGEGTHYSYLSFGSDD
uniref:Uncharacterized protein n=1 Tax=candidate division WOR-3 bacterium TaxID=2052148 RepID=A0A7C4CF42_UNCW3